jgi:hypothetical protein
MKKLNTLQEVLHVLADGYEVNDTWRTWELADFTEEVFRLSDIVFPCTIIGEEETEYDKKELLALREALQNVYNKYGRGHVEHDTQYMETMSGKGSTIVTRVYIETSETIEVR